MTKRYLIIILFFGSMLLSCNSLMQKNTNDKIIAQVGNDKLFYSKLKIAIPKDIKKADSILFAQNYIEKWVRNQLLLQKAEIYLDKKNLDEIQMMLENYETSLMVFHYQQMIIHQKLDTVVSDKEILDYYEKNSTNFALDSSVVKAIYVKLPKSVPDKYKLKRWMRSHQEKDLINIEDYCYQKAINFDMGEEWVYFSRLLSLMPKKIDNKEWFLKYNKFIEAYDSLNTYYVEIIDYKLSNDTKPVDFVKTQIKSIILNHRKMELINNLENNIYNDAVNQNKFTIYNNN